MEKLKQTQHMQKEVYNEFENVYDQINKKKI